MTKLHGVHHTARPTYKLKETVAFYRDVLGLPVVHAISAKGWGPEDHPDFLHFFFDSGNGSLIAFFYYLGQEPDSEPRGGPADWAFNSVHTAWRVETEAELVAWKEKIEQSGHHVQRVRHEIIDSIYVIDPNGYVVEISWQVRDILEADRFDATLTLDAAIAAEAESGARLTAIETVWGRKGDMLAAKLEEAA